MKIGQLSLLISLLLCLIATRAEVAEPPVPADYHGMWLIGGCSAPQMHVHIEGTGVQLYKADGRSPLGDFTVRGATEISDGMAFDLEAPNGVKVKMKLTKLRAHWGMIQFANASGQEDPAVDMERCSGRGLSLAQSGAYTKWDPVTGVNECITVENLELENVCSHAVSVYVLTIDGSVWKRAYQNAQIKPGEKHQLDFQPQLQIGWLACKPDQENCHKAQQCLKDIHDAGKSPLDLQAECAFRGKYQVL